MRVIVTGSREWSGPDALAVIDRRLSTLPPGSTVVHGACRGVDEIAGRCAARMGFAVEPHPAEWDRHGKAAGPRRNEAMLAAGADLVIAFHDDLDHSRGTKHMVSIARRAGVPVEVIA